MPNLCIYLSSLRDLQPMLCHRQKLLRVRARQQCPIRQKGIVEMDIFANFVAHSDSEHIVASVRILIVHILSHVLGIVAHRPLQVEGLVRYRPMRPQGKRGSIR